jgi:hypothetical protein
MATPTRPPSLPHGRGGRGRRAEPATFPRAVYISALNERTLPDMNVSISTPAPVTRFGYLPESTTGSKWLLDPSRLPDDPHGDMVSAHDPVDPRAAAADIRSFGDLLRDSYGVYHRYAAAGVDVPSLVERHATRVEQLQQPTGLEAFGPVFAELRAAVPDHHLIPFLGVAMDDIAPQLAFREFRGDPGAIAAAGGVSGAVGATAAVVPLLRADGTLGRTGTVSVMGMQGDAALHALGYVPVQHSAPDDTLASVGDEVYEYRDAGPTGYIRLTHFNPSNDADARKLAQFVADAPKHRKHERIVLDMRGHGGGSGIYAIDWAQQLRSTATPLRFPIHAVDTGTHRQQQVQLWNAGTHISNYTPDHPLASEAHEAAEQVRQQWPLHRDDSIPPPVPMPEYMGTGTGPSDWAGEVIVLVDRHTGSAGEYGPLMIKSYLNATIVGERTAGYVESGDMQQYQLPQTGLVVGVPSGHNVWRDPAIKEGAGLPVDIALEKPGMRAEDIVAHLERSKVP